jgi:hypothetical protein
VVLRRRRRRRRRVVTDSPVLTYDHERIAVREAPNPIDGRMIMCCHP